MLISVAAIAQAPLQSFTITVVNNGLTTKHEKKYIKQVKGIFPQLSNLSFVKNDAAAYIVKIIVDSPQVLNVVNVAPAMASILDMHRDNTVIPPIDDEKHFYNVSYIQQVIRVMLLDKNGAIISEKQSNGSPLFTQVYTRVVRLDGQTRNYSQVFGKDESPEKYCFLFMNNTPPKDFKYSTNVTQAMDSLGTL